MIGIVIIITFSSLLHIYQQDRPNLSVVAVKVLNLHTCMYAVTLRIWLT